MEDTVIDNNDNKKDLKDPKTGQEKKEFQDLQEARQKYDALQKQILYDAHIMAGLIYNFCDFPDGKRPAFDELLEALEDKLDNSSLTPQIQKDKTEFNFPGYIRMDSDVRTHLQGDEENDNLNLIVLGEAQTEITSKKQAFFNRLELYVANALKEQAPGSVKAGEAYEKLIPVCQFVIVFKAPDFVQNSGGSFGRVLYKTFGENSNGIKSYFSDVNLLMEQTHILFLGSPEEVEGSQDGQDKMFYLLNILMDPDKSAEEKKEVYRRVFNLEIPKKYYEEVIMGFESASDYIVNRSLEKGRQEGLVEGENRKQIEIARNMMKNSIFKTFDAALDGMGITDEADRQLIKDTLSSEGILG